ncbi:MAG: site-2 protease family protein [Patescibacteria group bacterium]
MLILQLFENPILFLAWAFALVVAISVHEFSHALAATLLGDPTAKYEGRLTLNPLKHLDPWGTLLLFFAGFGWGRPVPFNPYNLRNQRWGSALVSIAGPGSNLVMILVFGLILKYLYPLFGLGEQNMLFQFLYTLILLNAILMTFNLIPIPPLDGSKLLFAILPASMTDVKIFLERYGFLILIGLIFFAGGIFSRLFYFVISVIDRFIG